MSAYYNEFEQFAAAWLRELIKAGEIANGEVSEADMWDVIPSELMGFYQVHLCAGIGGWSAALRLAGWPDDRPVWTVSLPCQPFSAAGKGAGLTDERGQLADAFFWLAGICRPNVIFGEQVEAAIRHDWLDVMASQLESIGYTVGAVGFPASSVGAFHLRQRLYWCANLLAESERDGGRADEPGRGSEGGKIDGGCGATGVVGDSEGRGFGGLENEQGTARREARGHAFRPGATDNFWSDAEWIPCRDGKARPTKPGLFPLANGIPNRVGPLRGAGNAIVPQAAAEFIMAFMSLERR